jgi:hypothetical protein
VLSPLVVVRLFEVPLVGEVRLDDDRPAELLVELARLVEESVRDDRVLAETSPVVVNEMLVPDVAKIAGETATELEESVVEAPVEVDTDPVVVTDEVRDMLLEACSVVLDEGGSREVEADVDPETAELVVRDVVPNVEVANVVEGASVLDTEVEEDVSPGAAFASLRTKPVPLVGVMESWP